MIYPLREASAAFFAPVGGAVVETTVEPLDLEPGADDALGATVTVAFDNAGLFGDKDADIYDDVYPRYRALRNGWWRELDQLPVRPDPALRPYLLPVVADGAGLGPALPVGSRSSRDAEVVSLDSVPRSPYVDRLRREYALTHGLRSPAGRLFDLTEGLLLAVRSATDAVADLRSFVQLGAGTGAAAGMVLRRARPGRAVVHDDAPAVVQHLREHLGAVAIETGSALQVVEGDCRDLDFAGPVDLLVFGIPYAQQPSLLARCGPRLRDILAPAGVLVAATSTMGMRFYQSLIDGDDSRLAAWPWYQPRFSLRELFPCGATVRVRNQVISIASDDSYRVEATVAGMAARGGEVLT